MVDEAVRGILAGWLRAGMARLGLSPTELARQTGVSRDTIYRIINRESTAADETVRDLAKVVGEPPAIVGQSTPAETGPGSPVEASKPGGGTPGAPRGPGRRQEDIDLRAAGLRKDAARLDVLLRLIRSYRDSGESPSPEVLSEWLEIVRINSLGVGPPER